MHVYVATHEWLQPKTDFNRIVRMYYVVIRKVGHVVLCSARYTELQLCNIREMQYSIIRKHTEPVEPWPYWHMKRSEVPGQLHLTIGIHHHASDAVPRTEVFGNAIYKATRKLIAFLRVTRFLPLITS